MTKRHIVQITLVVDNYDKAIDFYINKLKFFLIEDTPLTETKRWVRISPDKENSCCLLLAQASTDEQISCIGNQTGGRVGFFLYTNDIETEYQNMVNNNITIIKEPISQPYGKVLVFADLYGNLWDVIEPN